MSFLNELKSKKSQLKEAKTIVTQTDGQRYVETMEGGTFTKTFHKASVYGFIVDTKPDDVPVLIKPNLYIGSQDCTSEMILQKYNIKNVLSLGIKLDLSIKNLFVECLDLPETNIIPILNICTNFIKDSLDSNKNVLVHCNAGVSRSSMVIIAYLICYDNCSYEDAYNLVKNKRPAIQPNAGFVRQLKMLKLSDLCLGSK